MKDYGCKQRLPHDYVTDYENLALKAERCRICGHTIQFQKDKEGRVDNNAYLEAHIRNFCQPHGTTAQLWYAIWHPELYDENKARWAISVCVSDECWIDGVFKCKHMEMAGAITLPDMATKGTNGAPQKGSDYGY